MKYLFVILLLNNVNPYYEESNKWCFLWSSISNLITNLKWQCLFFCTTLIHFQSFIIWLIFLALHHAIPISYEVKWPKVHWSEIDLSNINLKVSFHSSSYTTVTSTNFSHNKFLSNYFSSIVTVSHTSFLPSHLPPIPALKTRVFPSSRWATRHDANWGHSTIEFRKVDVYLGTKRDSDGNKGQKGCSRFFGRNSVDGSLC